MSRDLKSLPSTSSDAPAAGAAERRKTQQSPTTHSSESSSEDTSSSSEDTLSSEEAEGGEEAEEEAPGVGPPVHAAPSSTDARAEAGHDAAVADADWRHVPTPPRELSSPDRQRRLAFLGSWEQEWIESDKLDAILQIQGYSWATRKIVTNLKLNMRFTIDEEGDMHFTSQVPGSTTALKLVDGAEVEVCLLGTRMVYTISWGDEGEVILDMKTHRSGLPTTSARIAQRLDPTEDKIYSHNESIEGTYIRRLRRVT